MRLPNNNLPEAAILLNHAANRLKDERNYLAAYTAIRRALAIVPDHPVLLGTLGAVEWNRGRFEDARKALTRAAVLAPENPTYWAHMALALASLRRIRETERAYDRAVALRPGDEAVRWNRSQFRLSVGDWERGLQDYEGRVSFYGEPQYKKLPHPVWSGEDLNGKTLLICGEQGVGDTIMVSRYFSLLKERYPSVTLRWIIQQRLHDLFWEFRDIVEFWPTGHPWPPADFAVYQMSLPRIMGSSPDDVPAACGRLLKRAQSSAGSVVVPKPHMEGSLKIGIAWTGNPNMKSNEERSIPLETLLELAEDPRFTLYSLQVGPGADHLQFVGCNDLVRDCAPDLESYGFAGTAAVMLNLDLVLTVCTSNAHLAGALGVPCWVMLCSDPYWVWGREGSSSPWYPNMRLYRQHRHDDWSQVMTEVKDALASLWASRQMSRAA